MPGCATKNDQRTGVIACQELCIRLEGRCARAEASLGDRAMGELMRGFTNVSSHRPTA